MEEEKKHQIMTVQSMDNGRPLRQIKSFVLRQGRLTKSQENAMSAHWSDFGIDFKPQLLDFNVIFGNAHPVVLEIGFGMGTSLVEMAKQHPDRNYIGIEVHQPGVGACLKSIAEVGLSNLRVMCHDAVEVIDHMIPDESLARCQIFFPDPWHKAKHNKRRLIQIPFIEKLRSKLEIGGVIHLATDWQDYAEQMLEVMVQSPAFSNRSVEGSFIPRPDYRPLTKFEQRGLNLGHGVWDLEFERQS